MFVSASSSSKNPKEQIKKRMPVASFKFLNLDLRLHFIAMSQYWSSLIFVHDVMFSLLYVFHFPPLLTSLYWFLYQLHLLIKKNNNNNLQYSFNFYHNAAEAVVLGFQHYVLTLGITTLIPSLIVPQMGGDDVRIRPQFL